MKSVSADYAESNLKALLNSAQKERILVTRSGKPCAVILGIESYDQEDLQLASSPEFWRMIEKRRQEPSISLSELKARLRAKGNGRKAKEADDGGKKKGRSRNSKS
jgi:prevent-host-death family protein